jgi:RHS repeat-associated protein
VGIHFKPHLEFDENLFDFSTMITPARTVYTNNLNQADYHYIDTNNNSIRDIGETKTTYLDDFNGNRSGALTFQASYEAYGKRTASQGSTLDRQKANTKEEDPTGLLNEGFRYRDLESGTFITRDPLGFVDGPNMYSYVTQNPWTYFDPLGLASRKIPINSRARKRRDIRRAKTTRSIVWITWIFLLR